MPVSTPEPATVSSGLNAKPAVGYYVVHILAFMCKLIVVFVTYTFYFCYVVIYTLGFDLLSGTEFSLVNWEHILTNFLKVFSHFYWHATSVKNHGDRVRLK